MLHRIVIYIKSNPGNSTERRNLLAYRLRIRCLLFALFYASSNLHAADVDTFLDDLSIVVTPTRLRQNLSDTPASVTTITAEQIRRLGIRSVPESLRLIPGMIVGMASGNDYRISYHGTNGLIPRRMQVLVDGVSFYRTNYSRVEWTNFPVAIEDVDRIEVTRSPSAATYGSNSFLAVVNIITKHSQDSVGFRTKITAGSLATRDGLISYGGNVDSTSYRITANQHADDGYDENYKGVDRRDGSKVSLVDVRTDTILSNQSTLLFRGGVYWGDIQNEFAENAQITFPDIKEQNAYVRLSWLHDLSDTHQISVKGSATTVDYERMWRTCYPAIYFSKELRDLYAANPAYARAVLAKKIPSGGTAEDDALLAALNAKIQQLGANAFVKTCADANEDTKEHVFDFEVQDTYVFFDWLRAVSGAGAKRSMADSETFINGKLSVNSSRFFVNAEAKPSDWSVINLGAMWEAEERRTDGYAFSPRAAINFHVAQNHTVRFIYSEALRIPDFIELEGDWNYIARNLDPAYDGQTTSIWWTNAKGNKQLNPERIRSREISYFGRLPKQGMMWDVKIYSENLDQLISEKLQSFDYYPTNNNSTQLTGLEFQVDWRPTQYLTMYSTYARINSDASTFYEESLYSEHSGSASVSYIFDSGWTGTFGYYGASSIAGKPYDKFDLVARKEFVFNKRHTLDTMFKVSHFGGDHLFVVTDKFSVENKYDNDTQYYISLEYSY